MSSFLQTGKLCLPVSPSDKVMNSLQECLEGVKFKESPMCGNTSMNSTARNMSSSSFSEMMSFSKERFGEGKKMFQKMHYEHRRSSSHSACESKASGGFKQSESPKDLMRELSCGISELRMMISNLENQIGCAPKKDCIDKGSTVKESHNHQESCEALRCLHGHFQCQQERSRSLDTLCQDGSQDVGTASKLSMRAEIAAHLDILLQETGGEKVCEEDDLISSARSCGSGGFEFEFCVDETSYSADCEEESSTSCDAGDEHSHKSERHSIALRLLELMEELMAIMVHQKFN